VRSAVAHLVAAAVFTGLIQLPIAKGQDPEPEIVRAAPPKLDDFESDKNKDGVPDGWYNLRDAKIMAEGGAVGPHFLRFECSKQGRPARLSRAFGVDGRKHEAIVLGLWVRVEQIQAGERLGEDPGLLIDFLGDKLRQQTRGTLGPWTARTFSAYPGWTRVSKRIPVPPGTHDAIMSVGLLGATGVLDIDGLTIELVPVGGSETNNLVKNGGFELGDPEANGWASDNGGRRSTPGYRSNSALELAKAGARSMTGLALPIEKFPSLEVTVKANARGLRGAGGASALLFFLDENGRILPGLEAGVPVFVWSGTFEWREDRAVVPVPQGAVRAVLQVDKPDGLGSIRLDDLVVTAAPDPAASTWTPYHVDDEIDAWLPVAASTAIEPRSALDFSFLLDGPAGKHGPVTVKDGRLHYTRGGTRARFFGVQLLPPTAFLERESADALADRLARSGVNLVRLGDLDTPIGPDRSLFDDTRDDTQQLDPVALARLDHLIAALKARGIYVAIELQSARRFRSEDGVAMPGALPAGGGPAALFDPVLTKLAIETGKALLRHVNPETKLALKDDPVLAWVTLAGETSLFDMIDHPSSLPGDYGKAYRALASKSTTGTGRRFWQAIESSHWKELADALRTTGLKAPVAGVSHWRREREFSEAQGASGLDLIDDRIFWAGPSWISPRFRTLLWSLDGGLLPDASAKRRADKPYVLGQWCDYTHGAWASTFEAAEQLLAARTASAEDWDGLVRRGVFLHPEAWGSAAAGTGGGEDIFQIPEVANAAPHVFALWPHAASIFLRGHEPSKDKTRVEPPRRPGLRSRKHGVSGWEPDRGRLVIDTPYTEGVAGWPGGESVALEGLTFDVENNYAVVVASSAGPEPISRAKRLLVTAVGRVEPTGFLWVDEWRRDVADPGRPPLKQEPVLAKVLWKRKGSIKAYALDNNGTRIGPAKVEAAADGTRLVIDGTVPALHWELVVE
jgi:hypothetical protein